MKQRFSALDVCATTSALKERITGLRLQNLYDVNTKTLLFKFTKPNHKELVLIESGIRLHTTDYSRDKSITPSSFCMKLRKHLRGRRLTAVRQLGMDRVVDFEFAVQAGAQAEGSYHVLCEFYASGNIILTDHQYTILALLRVVRLDDDFSFAVGETYNLPGARDIAPMTRLELVAKLETAGPKDTLKRCLTTLGAYGPALTEHVIRKAGLGPSMRVTTALDLDPNSPHIEALLAAYAEAYEIVAELRKGARPGYISYTKTEDEELFEEFEPWLFAQLEGKQRLEFPSFAEATDTFFSRIEAQKLRLRVQQQEVAAERKLDAIKSEHDGRISSLERAHQKAEEQARRIELNLDFVDQAITIIRQAVAAGLDWTELEELVKDQREQGNPVAQRITALRLDVNQITLELDEPDAELSDSDSDSDSDMAFHGPLNVDVDIFMGAFANAQKYYQTRRQAGVKHAKTLAVSTQALQSAEQKIRADLKATKITTRVSQMRKPFWFEKFLWFVSSDGYLVIAGRDMQQNETLVKRYLKPGDAYVHADLHGAASVIVKNKLSAAPEATSVLDKSAAKPHTGAISAESIPPSTLFQAGTMSVCQSRAWDAKIVTSAWWVEARQVSKTAPTGEYLSTGSFMVRGKKHFLPPAQLVYGFGFVFRLADDESVARHAAVRKQRQAIIEENFKAANESTPQPTPINENANDDDESYTIVSAEAPADSQLDFGAARVKYNLDEVEAANAEQSNDEAKAQPTGTKKQLSAKERRQLRKQRKQTDNPAPNSGSDKPPAGKLSKKEVRRLEEEQKHEEAQQKQQPQKRGRKGKMKKIKEKYADQDDNDRELRMALLGTTGKAIDDVLADPTKSQHDGEGEEQNSSVKEQNGDVKNPPPSIVDQLNALSVSQPAENPERRNDDETKNDDDNEPLDINIDQLNVLDTITASPLPGDNLSFAIPVCAPYASLATHKYRVKLVPGSMKKGKACKTALSVMVAAADSNKPKVSARDENSDRLEMEAILAAREKDLMKAVPDVDMIAQMLAKVKVSAPNLAAVKQKAKGKGKRK